MRRLLTLTVVVVPALGLGQDLQAARAMMDSALAELSTHGRLTLVMQGKETDGPKQRQSYAVLATQFSIQNDGRLRAQLELMDYRDGALVNRIAGDGDRFWDYDVKSKIYTSAEYGTAPHVGKERERLFQNLQLRVKGEQTILSTLLRDAFGGQLKASTAWLPWRPNSQVKVEDTNIVCRSNAPSPNTLTYHLVPVPGFGFALDKITYYEEANVSGRLRTREWTVSIHRNEVPKDTSWFFVPPQGSRAVSVAGGDGF